MDLSLNFAGSSSSSFSSRPGSSSPPVQYSQPAGSTPNSSCRIPRIHTGAVIWYSGTPILFPARSFGSDSGLGRDEDARVAEEARGKHRDGDEGWLLPHERNAIRRERHLRRVELAVAQHPEEGLLDVEVLIHEVDALGTHAAVGERARAVVVPAREGKLELGHRIPRSLTRAAPGVQTVTGSVSSSGNRPCLAPSL